MKRLIKRRMKQFWLFWRNKSFAIRKNRSACVLFMVANMVEYIDGVIPISQKRKDLTTMPRRGENIRKRKDGRWEGRYICERTLDGKAKYRSIYAYSYTEVKKQLTSIQANRIEARPRLNKIVLFGEAAHQWLAARDLKLKHSTIVKYDEQLRKHILPVFSNTSLILLSDESIAAFLKQKL